MHPASYHAAEEMFNRSHVRPQSQKLHSDAKEPEHIQPGGYIFKLPYDGERLAVGERLGLSDNDAMLIAVPKFRPCILCSALAW